MLRLASISFRIVILAAALHVSAATWTVDNNMDTAVAPVPVNSLRYAILNANPGDTISFALPAATTITLAAPLPPIQGIHLTSAVDVTLDGAGLYPAFSAVSGTTAYTHLIIQNTQSLGGAGGTGVWGGGGGAAGGPALYLHTGATLSISNVTMNTNNATGGAGGNSGGMVAGGGGGGYSGGVGGNGSGVQSGGGGGGNLVRTGGGSGGSAGVGGTGGTMGVLYGGGGGGGSSGQTGGTAFTSPMANATNAGGVLAANGGGGGAGVSAAGGAGAVNTGGVGGAGLGSDGLFGGGGGGGATAVGGAGTGFGGGGGAGAGTGGAGGVLGGGGGGGSVTGGRGGLGAGGGGGTAGGTTIFGGGTGGNSGVAAGGGGGAALGGAIFIEKGATLTIQDAVSFGVNTVMGGAAGAGGGATGGTALSPDLFLQSGGTLVFQNAAASFTLASNINSDQGAGGGTGGGVIVNGSQTVVLGGTNTYTPSTTINSGTLSVSTDLNLGLASNPVIIQNGTLLLTGAAFASTRAISLTGAASIDTQANNGSLTGAISGVGSLNKLSAGSLTLAAGNSYSGGTTITAGTIIIPNDSALGAASSAVTMINGALQITATTTSTRPFVLTTAGTFTPSVGTTTTLNGPISSTGSLTMNGAGTLILNGSNSYTGGTTVSSGILQGTTLGLQGPILNNATLNFTQSFTGTYAGSFTGNGPLNFNGGIINLTGNSSAYTGPVTIVNGSLNVTGSLGTTAAAPGLTINPGTVLSGTGSIIGFVTNNGGAIHPGGSSIGVLTISGSAQFNAGSTLVIPIAPTAASGLLVSGTATLGGTVLVTPTAGFYGFSQTYPILSAGALVGAFLSASATNPAFITTLSQVGNFIFLNINILEPFLGFPFDSFNTRSVGNNLNALSASGQITPALVNIVNSMAGLTNGEINDALDQMDPVIYSALIGGLQPSVGAQLLSLFHRRPEMSCGTDPTNIRFWVTPMGNWQREGNLGEQVAYQGQTRGVAAGVDKAIGERWSLGIGAAWNVCDMLWQRNRGFGTVDRYLGAIYVDYRISSFYWGLSFYGGIDKNEITRTLQFSTNNLAMKGDFYSLDVGGQFSAYYLLGTPYCCIYPYVNCDGFYFHSPTFTETGGGGLNLTINSHPSSTVRTEAGLGLQVVDTNYNETICVSPSFSLGWAMECPVYRPEYVSRFADVTIPFLTRGWDHTFQLFTIDAALKITLWNFSFSGEYRSEIPTEGRDHFWNQRCNIQFEYRW